MERKSLYHSKAWKDIRKGYALSKHCQCERCGRYVYVDGISNYLPKEQRLKSIVHHKIYLTNENYTDDSVVFNWDNLELLCIDCHNKEHFEQSTRDGLMFDEFGNLIKSPRIKS